MQYQLLLVAILGGCFAAFKACEYPLVLAVVRTAAIIISVVAAVEFLKENI